MLASYNMSSICTDINWELIFVVAFLFVSDYDAIMIVALGENVISHV